MIFTAICIFFITSSAIAFVRAKDVFVMIQVIKIVNFYIIPILLITFALQQFSILIFAKIFIIILLNLITTILLCHAISKRAIEDKITPDGDFKNEK